MNWSEIRGHISERHELLVAHPDSVRFRWHRPGTDAVELVILEDTVLDIRCVMIAALVGRERAWADTGLATRIALENGAYVLRVSALLEPLQPAELDTLIDYVAAYFL